MADRYWIGGTGSWSDTAHWSTSSGGSGGASVPTSADDVYFNANSFNSGGSSFTVDVVAYCKNINFTGVTNSPSFTLNKTVYVYGNIALAENNTMTTAYGAFSFKGGGTQTFTSNGTSFASDIIIENDSTLSLQDDFSSERGIIFYSGQLDTNNHNVAAYWFYTDGAGSKTLNLGSSVITLTYTSASYSAWDMLTGSNKTLNAGTSKIIYQNPSYFDGGGFTYYDVEFKSGTSVITGSNTFHDIIIAAGLTHKFTAGTTQTITTMSGQGASENLITLESTASGTPYTISKASGLLNVNYYSVKDCIATGGATFNAYNSTDATGNIDWNFKSGDPFGDWITPVTNRTTGAKYSAIDLNRIENNTGYLGYFLGLYGYLADVLIKTSWLISDIPREAQTDALLANLATIRAVLAVFSTTPAIPASMDNLTYIQANNIEKILEDVNTLTTNMIAAWYYSGDLYCGEV